MVIGILKKMLIFGNYTKNFVLLDLFMDICCRGKKDGLAERIKESRTKFTDRNLVGDFDYLDSLLEEKD